MIAGDQNEWIRAAELDGAAQSFLDQIGQPWLVLYSARAREAGMKTARAALGGDDGFERPYERGRKLSPDDTMRLAFRRGGLAAALTD